MSIIQYIGLATLIVLAPHIDRKVAWSFACFGIALNLLLALFLLTRHVTT